MSDSIPQDTPLKRCNKCGNEYPATTEFFHSRGKLGLCPSCKECRQASRRKHPKRVYEPAPSGYKRCTKCQEAKPATVEYFYWMAGRGHLHPQCKVCCNLPKQHVPVPVEAESRFCPRCKSIYIAPLAQHFQRDASSKDGWRYICKQCCRQAKQASYKRHAEEEKAKKRAAYAADPEKFRAQKRARYAANPKPFRDSHRCWLNKPGNKERLKIRNQTYHRAYYAANKTRITERHRLYRVNHASQVAARSHTYVVAHREERRVYYRRYRTNHPEQERIRWQRRRARLRQIGGTHTAEDIRQQFRRQRGRCYYCHQKLDRYEIDHLIPISRPGSSNAPWNLVLACPTCNNRKHNKLPHEWPEGGRLL